MMELNNYGNFYINCDTLFEVELIKTVVDAYKLGASQKYDEINVSDCDYDFVEISATDRGKAIFEHLLGAVKNELCNHDNKVHDKAIAEYKKANNIKN